MKCKASTGVPWITSDQADELYRRAKPLLTELVELRGVDLLPDVPTLKTKIHNLETFIKGLESA